MKYPLTLLLVLCAAGASAAPAGLIVPAGAKARLHVEYRFTSDGTFKAPASDVIHTWKVLRRVDITANYTAEAPQAIGALHTKDPKQNQDIKTMEKVARSGHAKMQPTMDDMMRILQECGGEDHPDEACIERKVQAYGENMTITPEMKSARQDADTLQTMASGKRFQLWQMESQVGTYQVDEQVTHQVFELTCTQVKKCVRNTVRRGGGSIPSPDGRSLKGASLFEVDDLNKDLVFQLPVPLVLLEAKETVTTSIPDEQGSSTTVPMKPWMLQAAKLTVTVPADLKSASGSKEYQIGGQWEAGGKLTVSWQLTRL
jgi:hypothetical protein